MTNEAPRGAPRAETGSGHCAKRVACALATPDNPFGRQGLTGIAAHVDAWLPFARHGNGGHEREACPRARTRCGKLADLLSRMPPARRCKYLLRTRLPELIALDHS
ncbi:MAG TPA: hypothetical protein VL689_22645 [Paraburkholderia sp.]|nr:hypothetical protein [Paraburkholderia sp.]